MTQKSNLKKPPTPKSQQHFNTSDSSDLPVIPTGVGVPSMKPKPKENTEMNMKEKLKFTFKSSESVHKVINDEASNSKNAKNASNTQQASTPQTKEPTANNKESTGVIAVSNNNGRASSCVIDFKTVWFNFAAPPSVPITRKIDYTRLDWNLLSTAAPGITAWMNPCNRFAIKFVQMMKAFHLRRTAIAACLMADGLEVQGIQKHPKVKYKHLF